MLDRVCVCVRALYFRIAGQQRGVWLHGTEDRFLGMLRVVARMSLEFLAHGEVEVCACSLVCVAGL
jgi:hypothetical protein